MSSSSEESNPSQPLQKGERHLVKFITEKGAGFRTYHADGSWGMVNHTGGILLNFYLERPILPETATYEIDEKGTILNAVDLTGLTDDKNILVVREYQSAIAMNLAAARQIHATLANFIKIADDMAKGQKSNEQPN